MHYPHAWQVEANNMMSMKYLCIPTLLIFWLSACDNSPKQTRASSNMPAEKHTQATTGPEIILKQFIDASIQRQHSDFYNTLSTRDQATKTKEQYLDEQQKLQPNLADAYFKDISYQITAITLQGTEAHADVNYLYPDVERMIKQVYNLSILDSSALPPLDEMKLQIDTAFKDKPLPIKKITRRFNLIQENNAWRVHLGWDKQK